MTRLVITGLKTSEAARLARQGASGDIQVSTASDFDGAVQLSEGTVDFYVGICQSGAGAALAMAVGLVGSDRARSISSPGRAPTADNVHTLLEDGVIAFGVPLDHVTKAIPLVVDALSRRAAQGMDGP